MIRKDYLLKLLQQLDEALKKVSKLKKDGNTENALEIVEKSYEKLLKMKVPEQYENNFIDHLFHEKSLALDELNVLAELLKEEGDIYYELNEDDKSLSKYHQALEVFEYLNTKEKVFSFEREAKIDFMLERIKFLEN